MMFFGARYPKFTLRPPDVFMTMKEGGNFGSKCLNIPVVVQYCAQNVCKDRTLHYLCTVYAEDDKCLNVLYGTLTVNNWLSLRLFEIGAGITQK